MSDGTNSKKEKIGNAKYSVFHGFELLSVLVSSLEYIQMYR